MACIASISAQVSGESLDKSKKSSLHGKAFERGREEDLGLHPNSLPSPFEHLPRRLQK